MKIKIKYFTSIIVLCVCMMVFGAVLIKKYWTEPVIVTQQIIKELALTREMRIASTFIKQKAPYTPTRVADRIAYQAITKSRVAGIPYELTMGIIAVESAFNPYAVSSKQAKGLMQVLVKECSAGEINQGEIFDIDYNIECGIQVFKDHLGYSNGDLSDALFRYVGGSNDYINKVLCYMGEFMLFRESIMYKE